MKSLTMTLLQWQKSKTQQSCDRKQRFHTADLKRRCTCPLYQNCENTSGSAHPHSLPCLTYSQYIQDTQHLSHMTTYTQQSICHTSEPQDYRALFVHHCHNTYPVCHTHSVSMPLLAKHNIQLKKHNCHWSPTPPNTHTTQSMIQGVKIICRNDSCCIHTIISITISVLQTLKLKLCAGFAVSCMPEWCHFVGPSVISICSTPVLPQ